jgi:hypothetical protein
LKINNARVRSSGKSLAWSALPAANVVPGGPGEALPKDSASVASKNDDIGFNGYAKASSSREDSVTERESSNRKIKYEIFPPFPQPIQCAKHTQ